MKSADDKILSLFSLILNSRTHGNKDILNLYKTVGDMDTFVNIVKLFSGRKVQFPEKKEIDEAMTLAIVYYYHEEAGMSWSEIKHMMPFDIDTNYYSYKIRGLNRFLRNRLNQVLKESLKDGRQQEHREHEHGSGEET